MKFTSLFLLALVCAVNVVNGNAGIEAVLTGTGMDYWSKVAVTLVTKTIRRLTLPDVNGSNYRVHGMKISRFNPPSTQVTTESGRGIRARLIGGHAQVNGSAAGWITLQIIEKFVISQTVNFSASASDFNISILLAASRDGKGRPHIRMAQCSSRVGSASVNIIGSGFIEQLLGFFKDIISNKVKSFLQGSMCNLIGNQINDGNNVLKSFPLSIDFDVFTVSYGLSRNPEYTNRHMKVGLNGLVRRKGDIRMPPFQAQPLSTEETPPQMIGLYITEFAPNSFLFAEWNNGFLSHQLAPIKFPKEFKNYLTTTCNEGEKCLGNDFFNLTFVDELLKCKVRIKLHANQASGVEPPFVKFATNQATASGEGILEAFGACPGQTTEKLILKLNVKLTVQIAVRVEGTTIKGSASVPQVKLSILKPEFDIPKDALDQFAFLAIHSVVLPSINRRAGRGWPLPRVDKVAFNNTHVSVHPNYLLVACNLRYTGPM